MIILTVALVLVALCIGWLVGRPSSPVCEYHRYRTFTRVAYVQFRAGHVIEHLSTYGACSMCGRYYEPPDNPPRVRFNIQSDGTVEGTRLLVERGTK